MDRYDVSEPERFAEMVSAAEAGVEVEITRGGAVVATVVPVPVPRQSGADFVAKLREYWETLPSDLTGGDGAAEVRAMRDEGEH